MAAEAAYVQSGLSAGSSYDSASTALATELDEVHLMIRHITGFTAGQSNALYGVITRQVNFHFESYRASCAPLYCDITQVHQLGPLSCPVAMHPLPNPAQAECGLHSLR